MPIFIAQRYERMSNKRFSSIKIDEIKLVFCRENGSVISWRGKK